MSYTIPTETVEYRFAGGLSILLIIVIIMGIIFNEITVVNFIIGLFVGAIFGWILFELTKNMFEVRDDYITVKHRGIWILIAFLFIVVQAVLLRSTLGKNGYVFPFGMSAIFMVIVFLVMLFNTKPKVSLQIKRRSNYPRELGKDSKEETRIFE